MEVLNYIFNINMEIFIAIWGFFFLFLRPTDALTYPDFKNLVNKMRLLAEGIRYNVFLKMSPCKSGTFSDLMLS